MPDLGALLISYSDPLVIAIEHTCTVDIVTTSFDCTLNLLQWTGQVTGRTVDWLIENTVSISVKDGPMIGAITCSQSTDV
jgi:hypothetical protein